jgi:hypothetical protein
MHYLAAQLHSLAAGHGRESNEDALKHLEEAVKRGLAAKQFEKNEFFRPLFGDAKFQALCESATSRTYPSPAAPFVDPLKYGLR